MSAEGGTLVVGATGFLGSALMRELVAAGGAPRGTHRDRRGREAIDGMGGTPVAADLLDPAGLRRAMEGCALVYHLGGMNTLCPRDPGRLFEVNVRGSANVIEAAAAAGVRRVVYTSSAATIGERRGVVASEDTEHRGWFLSAYERSKYLAERRVVELGRELGVEVVCLNPSSVQGPGRTGGTARFLIRYAQGRLRWLVRTRVSLLAVDDCVAAHRRAAELGRPGQRYLLSSFTLPIEELLELAGQVTGVRHRLRFIPPRLALGGAVAVGRLAAAAGRRPPVCGEMVRTLLHGHAYDGRRAATELDLTYTSPEDLLRETFAWYSSQGLI